MITTVKRLVAAWTVMCIVVAITVLTFGREVTHSLQRWAIQIVEIDQHSIVHIAHLDSGSNAVFTLSIVGVTTMGAIGFIVFQCWQPGKPSDSGAAWARSLDLLRRGYLRDDGWRIGVYKNRWVSIPSAMQRRNILLVGPPGSGKTAGILAQILAQAASNFAAQQSFVIVDCKSDLQSYSEAVLSSSRNVIKFDPSDAVCICRFDPLSLLPEPSNPRFLAECDGLISCLLASTYTPVSETSTTNTGSDPYWLRLTQQITLSALLVFRSGINARGTLVQFAQWVQTIKIDEIEEALISSSIDGIRLQAALLQAVDRNDKIAGAAMSDVYSRLSIFNDPIVQTVMSSHSIDYEACVDQPTVVYVRIRQAESSHLAPIASLFLSTFYRQMIQRAERCDTNQLPREVRMIIDEFGSLPPIWGMKTAVATLRSAGVGHVLCVQSIAQLDIYGDGAQVIRDSCSTLIVLGGATDHDAQLISDRCGTRTTYRHSTTTTPTGTTSSWQPSTEPLLPAWNVRQTEGIAYVDSAGMSPMAVTLRFVDHTSHRFGWGLIQRMTGSLIHYEHKPGKITLDHPVLEKLTEETHEDGSEPIDRYDDVPHYNSLPDEK